MVSVRGVPWPYVYTVKLKMIYIGLTVRDGTVYSDANADLQCWYTVKDVYKE